MSILTLGAGLGVDGSAAFTPASIAGLDLWIEAGDLTTLFTDLGVTNVTTDGQAVEQWNDKSSAARNLQNATAGQRPLYKTDLTKPSILFDGVDDQMHSTGDVAWDDGSGQHWFAVSMQSSNVSSNLEIMTIKSSGAVYNCDLYTGGASAHLENLTSSTYEEGVSGATLVINTPVVLIGQATTTQLISYIDNVSGTAHTNVGTPSTVAGNMRLSNGGSPWPGRIFAACHGKGVLSSGNRSSLQTYLAGLHP